MHASIKLEKVSIWGVNTQARAATLRQWFIKGRQSQAVRIPILSEVSLEARHGDRIGIIGMNGSGKSSLLKVISGNYPIHLGRRHVEGTVAPLIEMGAGFDGELTGRQNIKLTYAYRGKLREYSKRTEEQIIEFSELGEKIELPLKVYSLGMTARLAFASAIFQDPDILLLDEIFAAGDLGFIEKSRNMLLAKVHQVSIAIMVSHNVSDLMLLCNRFVLMHHGRIINEGNLHDIFEQYHRDILHIAPPVEQQHD